MREKIVKLLEKGHREYFNRCSGMDKTFIEFIGDYLIANGGTVRAKGEWKWGQSKSNWNFWYMCSNCGFAPDEEHPYCPNCGSDMRGEEHEID